MGRRSREHGRVVSAWAFSIVGHLVMFGLGGLVFASSLHRGEVPAPPTQPMQVEPIALELPVMTDGTGEVSPKLPVTAPLAEVPRGGGEGIPRPDMAAHGRGGTDKAMLPALNLADRDEALLLSPDIMTRLDRSQITRIRSARARASREDWRASRTPMELTFLAEGREGERRERRTPSTYDPSTGARETGAPRREGGILGAAALPLDGDVPARMPGALVDGTDRASPGAGVRDGSPGADHRDSAKVPLARPWVAEGTPSIPSNREGKPSDTVDSEQEVALAMQSLVHASPAGGLAGAGIGGQEGPSPTGAGGPHGPGSTSHALGTGAGAGLDDDPRDRRRSEYVRRILAKVSPLWAHAFPKWAALDGLQGTVIVTFTVLADGSVASPVISRPSGIPEFDENCRNAVLRAAPFDPLPPELGQSLRWSLPFDMRNPAVRPKSTNVAARPSGDDG